MRSIGDIQVSNLFEFVDVLNEILSNDDAIDKSLWRVSLITRIGGRGSLHNLWMKLKSCGNVKQNKRKLDHTNPDEPHVAEGPVLKRLKFFQVWLV